MASGAPQDKNCDVGTANIGCGYVPPASDAASYGDTFNAVGGGTYAMQWDDEYIKVWHFARGDAPADIAAKKPEPEGWGKPQAVYGGASCDVKSHFRDMSIVLNINFCGDYGNAVWASDGCSALAPTCSEWVAKNPAAFANAYWDVNYIDAYVQGAGGSTPSSSSSSPSASFTTRLSQASGISEPAPTRFPGTAPGNNATFTRFPAANSSSLPSNGTSTRLAAASNNTSVATAAITTGSGPIPSATLPVPNGKTHANPASLNDFSYLGCFGSSSDFRSFDKVADSADMDLDQCTELCSGKKYAGVFDTSCYCAAELDADTRVSADACDTACPGDSSQFCGGRVKRNGGDLTDGAIGAKANVTRPQTSGSFSGSIPMPLATDDAVPSAFVNGTAGNNNSPRPERPTPSGTAGNSNSPRPERPTPSGTGVPGAKFNATTTTTVVASPSAKFNGTGPSNSSARVSSVAGFSSSVATPPTTAIVPVVPVARFNTSSSTTTSSADVVEVTIPVFPQPKVTNSTAPESALQTGVSSSSSSSAPAPEASGSAPPGLFLNSTFVGRAVHAARWPMLKSVHARAGATKLGRREAADFLLTVYAAVAKEEPPKQPPGMGIQTPHSPPAIIAPTVFAAVSTAGATQVVGGTSTTSTVVTTVHYQTVDPANPSKVINKEYVTTIVEVHCGCTETPPPVMTVSMETKVVTCSACGRHGENTVTLTVPCSTIATPTSVHAPPPPHGDVPSTPHGNEPHTPNGNEPHAPNGNEPHAPSGNEPHAPHGDAPPASSTKVPPPSNSKAPPAPPSNGDVPPAYNGKGPSPSSGNARPAVPSTVPVVAGASGLKATSLLFTTMLAMALLL